MLTLLIIAIDTAPILIKSLIIIFKRGCYEVELENIQEIAIETSTDFKVNYIISIKTLNSAFFEKAKQNNELKLDTIINKYDTNNKMTYKKLCQSYLNQFLFSSVNFDVTNRVQAVTMSTQQPEKWKYRNIVFYVLLWLALGSIAILSLASFIDNPKIQFQFSITVGVIGMIIGPILTLIQVYQQTIQAQKSLSNEKQ